MPLPQRELKKLYIQEKRSSAEIARIFNRSERTVNYWLAKYGIKKRSISEAVYLKYNPNGDPFKVIDKPKTINEAFLYGLGLGLFWGEGNKKSKDSIRLGNTDPDLIKKFIEFLIEICGVNKDKIRFGLQIFSDIPKNKALQFWVDKVNKYGFTKKQFYNIVVTPSGSIGTYREKSKYGVLSIYFANVKLKKILDNMLASVAQGQSNSMVNIAHFNGNVRVNPELRLKA